MLDFIGSTVYDCVVNRRIELSRMGRYVLCLEVGIYRLEVISRAGGDIFYSRMF